jgi:cation:H+ antiporter
MVYILFLIGFSLLFLGGKYLVEGAVSFARDLKVSPLLIGVVLVGFGTSVPELITCIGAILAGSSDIAIGNIVGSNIANILLVLSIGAIICTIPIDKKEFKRDGAALILSSVLLTFVCVAGFVNLYIGAFFVLCLLGYIFVCYKAGAMDDDDIPLISKSVFISFAVAILGIAGVVVGANLLIDSSLEIASVLGVSETLIGLSAVAIGTSLPELATIIAASLKKHSSLALGNVIGSNIFNTLGVLGVTSFFGNIEISKSVLRFDIWIMNLAVLAMMIMCMNKWKLTKSKGIALLVLYIAYIGAITIRG